MKENQQTRAGRKGGLVRTAKGFAVNAAAHFKAIRKSAATRKRQALERRRLVAALIKGGSIT